jgi:putative ABC transport system permease protein
MSNLLQSIHHSARILLRNPVFTAVAILTLALGIGASTAVFTAVNGILLRPLPFKSPDQLVWVTNLTPQSEEIPVSPGDFSDWRKRADMFQDVGAFIAYTTYNISGGDVPEQVKGVITTVDLFPMLGVSPSVGNLFPPEASQPGQGRLVLISDGLWRRRFGTSRHVVGQTMMLNAQSFTIVGVMPAGFKFPVTGAKFTEVADLWIPLSFDQDQMADRTTNFFSVIGRLKPSATVAQAQASMNVLSKQLAEQYPNTNSGRSVKVVSLHEHFVGNTRPVFVVLLAAVGFVLLIACANVANLLLARNWARQKEIAIRVALGASRGRLFKHFLTESMLMALAGGAFGLLLAYLGTSLSVKLSPSDVPRLDEVSLNKDVLTFTLAASIITTLFFGLVPALQASRSTPNDALKERGAASSVSIRHHWVRNIFVVAEMALALALLIAAGLSVRSFLSLINVDPGLKADNVVTAELFLSPVKYLQVDQRATFYQQVLQRVGALPGVEAISLTDSLPLTGADLSTTVNLEGQPKPLPGDEKRASYRVVSPNYFQTMSIPLLQGRDFSEQDSPTGTHYVVVNQAFAREFLGGQEAVGKRLANGYEEGEAPREIIGVVGDVRHFGLEADAKPEIYVPYVQNPGFFMYLAVRGRTDPNNLIAAIRRHIQAIDKDQPLANIKPMGQIVSDSVAQRRLSMVLLVIFSGIALVLAAVGIYSILAYSVIERTHEIGIRMALGAQRRDILKLILKQGMRLVLLGSIFGLFVAYLLTRVTSNMLYGISTSDPGTFVAASVLLAAVALMACYISAQKATRLDPMAAIRYN